MPEPGWHAVGNDKRRQCHGWSMIGYERDYYLDYLTKAVNGFLLAYDGESVQYCKVMKKSGCFNCRRYGHATSALAAYRLHNRNELELEAKREA